MMKVVKKFRIDGRTVSEAEFNRLSRSRGKAGASALNRSDHWRNYKSRGLSVHSSQVEEFSADAKAAGLTGVRFDKDGTCRISSREQRKKYLALRGCVDNDGGYGD